VAAGLVVAALVMLNLGSTLARAYMFFHPSVNTVSFPSQNMGRLMVQIQKIGANMQSLKNESKRAVRCENEGSFAIDSFNIWYNGDLVTTYIIVASTYKVHGVGSFFQSLI